MMLVNFALLVGLLACSLSACLASIGKIDGYFSAKTYFSSTDCQGADVGGYVFNSYGNCVKIFGGPQDPSTSLTSYKVSNVKNENGSIVFTKQLYSDGACEVAAGAATTSSIEVGKCKVGDGETPVSYEYSNTTQALANSPISGLMVSGYQEYSYCAQKARTSYEFIYPNNYCYAQTGRTKSGANYKSFTYNCAGKKLTQNFFSESTCTQSVAAVTTSLETVDTTCYTNMQAEYDYNLFETSVCVDASMSAASIAMPAKSETHASSKSDLLEIVVPKRFSSGPLPFRK